jgi:preprotein translocase subunit SecE
LVERRIPNPGVGGSNPSWPVLTCLGIMFSKAIEFLVEVRAEVKRVTWPTRREAMGGTAVVVFVVLVMALFLGIVDAILSRVVQGLINI